ncbi:choline-sulfatase [Novosphingobium sp.]|uniref:choline-sulfatase n=1 Tax=Novosphingobium sp. TaxID=1874826 RepID=UPI003D134DDC
MTGRPNILVLMADQMTAEMVPFLSDSPVIAPNLTRLAQQGVLFRSAYSNSPLCAPARFSMLAGQLPSRIGAYDNACEFTADTPTVAHYLRAGGYRTILAGKMHFVGPDQLHGFEERLTTDIYPADFSWTPDWTRPDHRPHWYHSMDSVLTAGPAVRTNQIDYDEEVVYATRRKLYDIVRDKDQRPFFMVTSMTHPHDPYAIPRKYWDMYEGVEIPMPNVDAPLDPHSARLRAVSAMDETPVSDEQVRAARRAYFGAISFVDEQVGTVLQTLEDTGQIDNTVVILLTDHGDMLGERGLWYKMNFFEGAAHIPIIVHAPGRFAARDIDASVSLLDLLPTCLDLAGLTPEFAAPVDGHSLMPHLLGETGTDEAIGEYLGEGAVAPIVMIRRGVYKFVHCPVDPDQLYDLSADPGERHNLAADPAHAERVIALRAEVAQRWDLDAITAQVIASQRRRRLVAQANATGRLNAWDWSPPRDASSEYVRNHMDLEELEAAARYPRVR